MTTPRRRLTVRGSRSIADREHGATGEDRAAAPISNASASAITLGTARTRGATTVGAGRKRAAKMPRLAMVAAVVGLGGYTALDVCGGGSDSVPRGALMTTPSRTHSDVARPRIAPALPPPLANVRGSTESAGGRDDVPSREDSASPNYDPVIASLRVDVDPREVLRREPRAPAFATRREQVLHDRLTERLRRRVPFTTHLKVTCYTSSCELVLEGGQTSEDLNIALDAMELQLLADAESIGPLDDRGSDRRNGLSIILLYSPAERDHAAYDEMLRRHQERDDLATAAP